MQLFNKLRSNKGIGLVGMVLLTSLAIGAGISAALMTSSALQKKAAHQVNDSFAKAANSNAVLVIKNLIQSGALVQNATTKVWSAASTPASSLWAVGTTTLPNFGVFNVYQCDPRVTPISPDGSVPSLATCIANNSTTNVNNSTVITSQVLFQQVMVDGRQQINVSTSYLGKNYALNALIGTATVCADYSQTYTAGLMRDISGNPITDSYGNVASTLTMQSEASAPFFFAAKLAGITSPTHGPYYLMDASQPPILTYGQPSAYIQRSTGGTDWTNGNVDITGMTAICNSLGYATYVSSTCSDSERSGSYPQGKCNYNSPGDDALSYYDATQKLFPTIVGPDKMSVTWLASITCNGKLDPTCAATSTLPTTTAAVAGNWLASTGGYVNIAQTGSQLTYTALGSPNTVYTGNVLSGSSVSLSIPFDDNRNSISNAMQIGTVNPTNDMIVFSGGVTYNRAVPLTSLAINFGGPTVGAYVADVDDTGGTNSSTGSTIDLSKVTNPAPEAVYQTGIYGNITVAIPNLQPGSMYNIRLHTSENTFSGPNKRVFNLSVNGTQVLTNYDIYAQAGGKNIAVIPSFVSIPDAYGMLTFTFTGVTDNPYINAIDLTQQVGPIPVPPVPTGLTIAGSGTTGLNLSWTSGGGSTTAFEVAYAQGSTPPSCSGATNVGNVTSYQLTGLTANTSYSVSVCALNYSNVASATALTGTQATLKYYLGLNSGTSTIGNFVIDSSYASAGTTSSTSSTISTSTASNPAPAAVYQDYRYGNFNYTITGLTKGATYNVRLHFAEVYWTSSGKRTFNVTLNGTTVLTKYDIFASSGGENIAVTVPFTVTANSSGQIIIGFVTVINNAMVNAVEIYQ